MGAKVSSMAAVLGALAVVACTSETVCEYENETPSGDINRDIVGCWQGIGEQDLRQDPAFLVVYEFHPETAGGERPFREVQSPNRIFASGNEFFSAWEVTDAAVDGGPSDLTIHGGFPLATAQVNDTSLLLDFFFQVGNQVLVLPQPLRRARACTGYGYEQGNTCPQP